MRPRTLLPLTFFLAASALCAAKAQEEDGLKVADTPLFIEKDGKLLQLLHVAGGDTTPDSWLVERNGSRVDVRKDDVRKHKGGWLLPIPVVEKPTLVRVVAIGNGGGKCLVRPRKRWTIYLTPHTHFDVGFTDTQPRVLEHLARDLEQTLDICKQTDDFPEEARFRWTIECTALLEDFEKKKAPVVPKIIERVKQGRIELCGTYANLLTELCGDEELCRSFYPAAHYRNKYGITVDTAMHNDIPGATWQLPQLMVRSGIRYFAFRANPVRAKFVWDRGGAPERPFIWESPDGSGILTWYTDSYREANFFRAGCPPTALQDWSSKGNQYDNMLAMIARQEAKGTPVDCIQMRMGGDNITPTINPCHWARLWNHRFAYPKLVVATNRMFFEAIEKFRPQLKALRGAIPDWWADGGGSAAKETGINRINHERTGTAEGMCALMGVKAAQHTWPLYSQMLYYDEHTWGSSRGLRTSDPENAETQWRIKSNFSVWADRMSREIMEFAKANLAAEARHAEKTRLVVWNPSSWRREGVVRVALPEGSAVFESGSSKPLRMQPAGDMHAVEVRDIPALGWKAFEIRPGSVPASGGAPAAPPDDWPLPTYIYETGAKRDKLFPLRDKVTEKKNYATVAPAKPRLTADGPVFAEWTFPEVSAPGANALGLRVRGRGVGRIDIEVFLDKIRTEEVEGVYLEFPFDLKKPTARVGIPFGWVDVENERLQCTCTDFFSMDRAVDLNDGERGVTLAAVEAPLVEFGKITTDAWADVLQVEEPKIYSYVMNNYWFTNYPFSQGGPNTFRYAVRTYKGRFDPAAAARFGEEVARPLAAVVVPPGDRGEWAGRDSWSAIEIRPGSVRVAAVKAAEDGRGIVIRLAEMAGKPAEVWLSAAGLGKGKLTRCSLVEEDLGEIGAADGSSTFKMNPWEVATVRFVAD